MFHVASPEQIKAGEVLDVYFHRTMTVLEHIGMDKVVKAEFLAKSLRWPWAVLAGIEEAAEILTNLDIKVRIAPEGTVFRAWEPILEIEGRYTEFGRFETALLGLMCQASGVATMAARCKVAAQGRPVFSFGARRVHPAVAPMMERNAYIGGCDGVAEVMGAKLAGIEPTGTMPHAVILMMGDTVKAAKAFDEAVDESIRRVVLIDTFNDEQVEAVRVAEALGDRLFGVRLDTPGSRRGDMRRILYETRWELDARGFNHVKLLVSGGVDEYKIPPLNDYADVYGVGTTISSAPVVDFSMDIIEIEGKPAAKRGQRSGSKSLLVCDACGGREVTLYADDPPACQCGGKRRDLLAPLGPLPPAGQIRDHVLSQTAEFGLDDL